MQLRTASSRRPRLTEDIMPFSEYRGNLAACFDRVNETHRPIVVTRKGRAAAVLVGAEDFDPLMDVFLLAGTVRKSRKELAEGRGVAHETAMRRFRERHGI
jgi:prevent-host-death family protein